MRKYAVRLIAVIAVLGVACGCKKQTLALPEYPLDSETITAALEQAQLPWTIVEGEKWPDNRYLYTLVDKDGMKVAFIVSGIYGDRRQLEVSLNAYQEQTSATAPVPEEYWEQTIVFATLLYGAFDTTHQVYDRFVADYDEYNTVKVPRTKLQDGKQIEDDGEFSTWRSTINHIFCTIRTEQPYSNKPQEYLNTIQFDTIDIFGFHAKNAQQNNAR